MRQNRYVILNKDFEKAYKVRIGQCGALRLSVIEPLGHGLTRFARFCLCVWLICAL